MRLSDVLSKPPVSRFEQVDNFLGKTKLNCGKQRKVNVGIVGLTYFCKHCDDDMTFVSDNELFCIGINDCRVSILKRSLEQKLLLAGARAGRRKYESLRKAASGTLPGRGGV